MKRTLTALALIGTVSGCMAPQVDPVVSQFNGDSVSIEIPIGENFMQADQRAEVRAEAHAEADRICRKGSRKRAEATSVRYTPTSQYSGYTTYMYLCLS